MANRNLDLDVATIYTLISNTKYKHDILHNNIYTYIIYTWYITTGTCSSFRILCTAHLSLMKYDSSLLWVSISKMYENWFIWEKYCILWSHFKVWHSKVDFESLLRELEALEDSERIRNTRASRPHEHNIQLYVLPTCTCSTTLKLNRDCRDHHRPQWVCSL